MTTINLPAFKPTQTTVLEDTVGKTTLTLNSTDGFNPNNARMTTGNANVANYASDGTKATISTNGTVQITNTETDETYRFELNKQGQVTAKDKDGTEVKVDIGTIGQQSTFEIGDSKFTFKIANDKTGKPAIDSVVITSGDYGVVIDGTAPDSVNKKDLKVTQYHNGGAALDLATADGVRYSEHQTKAALQVLDPTTQARVLANQTTIDKAETAYAAQQAKLAQPSPTATLAQVAEAVGPAGAQALSKSGLNLQSTLAEVLGNNVDYSKLSWRAVLFKVIGEAMNYATEGLKNDATSMGIKSKREKEETAGTTATVIDNDKRSKEEVSMAINLGSSSLTSLAGLAGSAKAADDALGRIVT
jgi:hypothetical protein